MTQYKTKTKIDLKHDCSLICCQLNRMIFLPRPNDLSKFKQIHFIAFSSFSTFRSFGSLLVRSAATATSSLMQFFVMQSRTPKTNECKWKLWHRIIYERAKLRRVFMCKCSERASLVEIDMMMNAWKGIPTSSQCISVSVRSIGGQAIGTPVRPAFWSLGLPWRLLDVS